MMAKEVGYLTNYHGRLEGERGIFFDYILAANGIFIEASNPILSARIPVSECQIRGLAPIKPRISMTYGSIPQSFFDLALDRFLATPEVEAYVGVIANAGYHFYIPDQDKQEAKVVYNIGNSVILDIHSHGSMRAFFSKQQDDKDETGLKLYAVVGNLRETPIVCLRAGVYGYFWPLSWKDVFDGTLCGAREFEEEVIGDELQSSVGGESAGAELHNSGVWWHRWFRS